MPARVWEPSVPAACVTAPWATTAPITTVATVVQLSSQPVVPRLPTRRLPLTVAVTLEAVASAAAVPVLLAEAVASAVVAAVEAVQPVAMQADADK